MAQAASIPSRSRSSAGRAIAVRLKTSMQNLIYFWQLNDETIADSSVACICRADGARGGVVHTSATAAGRMGGYGGLHEFAL